MKTEVQCADCKTPHFDHYGCDKCGHKIGSFFDAKNDWEFCPYCGTPLNEDEKIALCGHPERFWKVEPDNSSAWCLQCAVDKLAEELAYYRV